MRACRDRARRLSRARLLVSGSAGLPVRENDRLHRLFGSRVVVRFGLSETLINTAARHDGPRTPGTVGPPLPGIALRLVRVERLEQVTRDARLTRGAHDHEHVLVSGPTGRPDQVPEPPVGTPSHQSKPTGWNGSRARNAVRSVAQAYGERHES